MTGKGDRRPHGVSIRLPEDVHERLRVAAEERDLSMNYLAHRAIVQFLDRLIPVDEWKLTRDD